MKILKIQKNYFKMGIKSTHLVTRESAIQIIKQKIEEIDSLNDEELANLLEEVIHNGFYNFEVVSDEEFKEQMEQEYPLPYIDIYNIPERNNAW